MGQHNFQCARECAVLFQEAARFYVLDGAGDKPTASTAFAHEFDALDRFERNGGVVLADVLMALPPERFAIPASFPYCERYTATLSGDALFARLEGLRDRLSARRSEHTPRPLYLNWVVRYVLRAGYALHHRDAFGDVFLVADHADPAAPAALNPDDYLCSSDELDALFPDGTNSPEFLGE